MGEEEIRTDVAALLIGGVAAVVVPIAALGRGDALLPIRTGPFLCRVAAGQAILCKSPCITPSPRDGWAQKERGGWGQPASSASSAQSRRPSQRTRSETQRRPPSQAISSRPHRRMPARQPSMRKASSVGLKRQPHTRSPPDNAWTQDERGRKERISGTGGQTRGA